MRRNKLFLAISTCLLAVGGVFGTRAAKKIIPYTRYYCTKISHQHCFTYIAACTFNTGSFLCVATIGIGADSYVYTLYSFNSHPLAPDGCLTAISKCVKRVYKTFD